ncbi:xanthine dehydrogenase family protein subunit M [Janibacter cremeus]|uniref:FAD binding domain-containing protein n=1 Tax=Janibacter cremeus TaxID=1285192 RepID=UPI0023F757E7|nr:xanthine dehydrogenase family protein subunit M [Janibacter cremeus]WEV78397.1 xanthine dehydrogenase family protein subunit M [Janibacter cremeus]
MRPVDFDYTSPTTLEEVVRSLADGGDEATIIGGGQSLMPVLRMRMADPDLLVDLRRIPGMREVREEGDHVVVGAMATHHAVAHDALVAAHAGVLGQAAACVGDPQIRYRGTIGGSLAHADPAGDIAPAVLALDGTIEVTGPDGARTVPAKEFFHGPFTTDLRDGEVLTAVRLPKHTGWGMRYEKFAHVAQSWSIVAVAAAVQVEDGAVARVRLGMANMGQTPLRAESAEAALTGVPLQERAVHDAAAGAGEGTSPPVDAAGTAEYRRHLAGVLAGRAVAAAVGVVE